eukprot:2048009-Alexandrium_andersonii.AAC.1
MGPLGLVASSRSGAASLPALRRPTTAESQTARYSMFKYVCVPVRQVRVFARACLRLPAFASGSASSVCLSAWLCGWLSVSSRRVCVSVS